MKVKARSKPSKEANAARRRLNEFCWEKRYEKWLAQIRIDGKKRHLGYVDSENVAARKYDEAASLVGNVTEPCE